MKHKSASLVVLALLASGACSKVKKLEGMATTTDKMRVTTEEMSKTTIKLEEENSEAMPLMKSATSAKTREDKMKLVKDPSIGQAQRCGEAAVYYRAFEYQVAGSRAYIETPEQIEEFLLDAANEYTRIMADMYKRVNFKKMSPLNDGPKHVDESAFYSMAAAMHEVHTFHKQMTKKHNLDQLSFYDLITESLAKENSRSLKRHERALISGANRKVMIALLKARVDMIAAVALNHMVDKDQMSLGNKGSAVLFKLSAGKLGGLEVPTVINDSNPGTKETVIETLKKALETKTFLKGIGIEVELNKELNSIFSNLDIKENENKEDSQDLEEIKNQIAELLN